MRQTRRFGGWCLHVVLALGVGSGGGEGLEAQSVPAQLRGGGPLSGVVDTEGPDRLRGLAWRFRTGGPVRSAPTLAEGVAYFGSSDGFLYAVDADHGTLLWRHRAGAPVGGAPLVTGELVIFTDRENRIHAVERAGGNSRWMVETGPDLPLEWGYEGWDYLLPSPILADDGTLLVGSGDGRLYALDPATGRERWRFDTGGRIRSAPAVLDGIAYFGSGDGFVYAVSVVDGSEEWRFATAGVAMDASDFGFDRTQITGSPTVADGVLYIGSRDASLYALDLGTREPLWTLEEGTSWVIATPAVHGDRVFSGRSGSGTFRAVDAATGEELWMLRTGGPVFASPVVVDGTVYVASGGGSVQALDATDGTVRWSYHLGAGSYSTPAVWNGRLYVGSDDGHLYALEAASSDAPRLGVYWDDSLMERSVVGSVDAHRPLAAHFTTRGYEPLDGPALSTFLEERIRDGAPSVVVFAMDGVPAGVADPEAGPESLLRRYLHAGGKAIWLGRPPLLMAWDPETGQVTGVERSRPSELLGVDFTPWNGDVYGVSVTDAGRRWGLDQGWLDGPSVAPSPDVTPLAVDELGRISAWVRSYGGAPGTGFVLLRGSTRWDRLEAIRRVAEFGVFRAPVQGSR